MSNFDFFSIKFYYKLKKKIEKKIPNYFSFSFFSVWTDWHVGVRVVKSGLLVGFISAIPGHIRIYDKAEKIVEINFLCVHKKLRSKRVAPVLIREITRRVNLTGIFQAVYTAGVVLPKPIATCRYWHRSLNPKKLIQVCCSFLFTDISF